ncbi:hypothetical protein COV24_04110 [candidate division WWE3 bacterium CG10_big_fil_rev_8_21_14_0_10_32_10]|uniref:Uncharacterized protein n=1 Tax=candidate division WWE3 bacterium CG10_big_fil_rev_8_21_14_0_10_32_10 TaxID=1975090 RepID=A0A2H0R9P7_UNCKA|nr:MAG: hypothetical protein COV24_04110 [candidate division WWE3 bacterium CG10_big_fil_rev_8_21_14_0_10_32_10]
MKNILILLVLGIISYYVITAFLPTKHAVDICIDNYLSTKTFRSVLEDIPRGQSGDVYCQHNFKIIKNFGVCLNTAETNQTIPNSASFYYEYVRLFSTDISSLEHVILEHNTECRNYNMYLFK